MKSTVSPTSVAWIISVILGLTISAIGIYILAEYHPIVYGCQFNENRSQSEECSDAETYENTGIVITIAGFIVFVTCGIIGLFTVETVIFTCPRCQMSKRMNTSSIPTSCPKCDLQVGDFENYRSRE
jgi:uncharacterized membrane protein